MRECRNDNASLTISTEDRVSATEEHGRKGHRRTQENSHRRTHANSHRRTQKNTEALHSSTKHRLCSSVFVCGPCLSEFFCGCSVAFICGKSWPVFVCGSTRVTFARTASSTGVMQRS